MSRSLRQGSWVHQGVVRPLVVAIALSLIVPSRAVAGDPMPVRDAGTGATATPTTPAGVQVATQTSTTFGTGDVFCASGGTGGRSKTP